MCTVKFFFFGIQLLDSGRSVNRTRLGFPKFPGLNKFITESRCGASSNIELLVRCHADDGRQPWEGVGMTAGRISVRAGCRVQGSRFVF